VYKEELPECQGLSRRSRSFYNSLCQRGAVFVNGKEASKGQKINCGDQIEYEDADESNSCESAVQPEDIPLDILYEDEHIIAVNKPPGMVVHPAPGSPNGTFVNALLYHLGNDASEKLLLSLNENSEINNVDGNNEYKDTMLETDHMLGENSKQNLIRPGIVHRLDKGTSGILLAGKHPEAVSKLCEIFALRKIRKLYVTVCVGNPGETTIDENIGRSIKNRQVMTVVPKVEFDSYTSLDGVRSFTTNGNTKKRTGKPAISHVKAIAFDGKMSVVAVKIETGRTHQIRVHLQDRRTPVVGDETYGNNDWNKKMKKNDKINRPLLHAYETEFIHPFTNENIVLNAPLPPDMYNLMDKISGPKCENVLHRTQPVTMLLDDTKKMFNLDMLNFFQGTGKADSRFVPSERLVIPEDDDMDDNWIYHDTEQE